MNINEIMTPELIHDIAVSEFELEPRPRSDGRSYWIPETSTSKAVRILRVSQNSAGVVHEVKLAVSSLAAGKDVFLTPPLTEEKVRRAVTSELSGGSR
jgi:hypothetical protein